MAAAIESNNMGGDLEREFSFTVKNFHWVREELYQYAGITLADHKRDMVYNRLVKRMRANHLSEFEDYFTLVKQNDDEYTEFVNALTTNLTSFFRENHHFQFLEAELFPKIIQAGQKTIRGWSAGCSLGEEAYSIGMTVFQTPKMPLDMDIKILATDIDSKVLEKAASGVFGGDRLRSMDERFKKKYFRRNRSTGLDEYKLKDEIRDLVYFRHLNIIGEWPLSKPMDFIFFRNVMIYFDKETQKSILDRMADIVKPDGYLFVGHSESPFRLTDRFKLVGKTIYKRVK